MSELQPSPAFDVSPAPIGRLAAKYMVARHFKRPAIGLPDTRWNKVAAQLKKTLSSLSGAVPSPTVIHELAEQLGKVAPTREDTEMNLLSAATKFLWFTGQDKVRILDKRAVATLSLLQYVSDIGADYAKYEAAWNRHFATFKPEIIVALKELPLHLEWSRIPPDSRPAAQAVFKSTWFAERVFDKYLWVQGSDGGLFE